jgi:hypothetical protein
MNPWSEWVVTVRMIGSRKRHTPRMAGFGRVRRKYRELLPQGRILEHQMTMSACQDDQEPNQVDDASDHAPACTVGSRCSGLLGVDVLANNSW